MGPFCDLTDEQWGHVAALLADLPASKKGKRPQRLDRRGAFNGVLWTLRTGSPWNAMPACFPFHDTCRLCFWAWADSGALERAMDALAIPAADEARVRLGQRVAVRRRRECDRFELLHSRDRKLAWYLRCLAEMQGVADGAGAP